MKLQATLAAVLIALAGCGGDDDQLDREQLVPKGMRRTTVTAADTRTEAVPAAERPAATTAGEPAPDIAAATTEEPATEVTAAPAPAPPAAVPVEVTAPAAGGGAFVVQAGAFKQAATAEGVVARLQGLGIAARIEIADVAGGTFHRVVVPGLADRPAADALVARLKQELGIDAVVRTP